MGEWLEQVGVKTLCIKPGFPWEHRSIESFNGKRPDHPLAGLPWWIDLGSITGGRSPGPVLDLYGPAAKHDSPLPIVLFVHGGAWRFGDKAMVGDKPAAFVSRGYLFASANYRLDESVSPRELGLPEDGPTGQIFDFLADELGGE